jgi:hypothetical protein
MSEAYTSPTEAELAGWRTWAEGRVREDDFKILRLIRALREARTEAASAKAANRAEFEGHKVTVADSQARIAALEAELAKERNYSQATAPLLASLQAENARLWAEKKALEADKARLMEVLRLAVENIQGIADGNDIPSIVIREKALAAIDAAKEQG